MGPRQCARGLEPSYEPLQEASFKHSTLKTVFLIAMASAGYDQAGLAYTVSLPTEVSMAGECEGASAGPPSGLITTC